MCGWNLFFSCAEFGNLKGEIPNTEVTVVTNKSTNSEKIT